MIIKAIKFKRTEKSEFERGISFEADGNANNIIIDKDGNILKPDKQGIICYDCKDDVLTLCIDINLLNP